MVERRRTAGVILLLLMGGAGCEKSSPPTPASTLVRLAHSNSAPQLGKIISRLPNVSVEEVVLQNGGSIAVVAELQKGAIDIGAATADVSYLSLVGRLGTEPPFKELRAIAVLGLNVVHLFVREDLSRKVTSVSDLRGLRVNVGARNSGTALIAQLSLKASGVELTDIHAEFVPYSSALKQLAAGTLDATFAVFDPESGNTPIHGARLIEMDGASVERLRLQQPFVSRTLIPRATYPHQDRAIWTIGVDLLLVCRSSLDDSLVTRVLESYFAPLGDSGALGLDRASTSIPLHPAAARFFRRRELSQ
jgi:TRAP transporter TAXI family solute receptor